MSKRQRKPRLIASRMHPAFRMVTLKQVQQRQRHVARAQRCKAKLIPLLTQYIQAHYSNPAQSRIGVIIDGPVAARLAAAAALRALLLDTDDGARAYVPPSEGKW